MFKKLVVLVCMFGLLFGNVGVAHAESTRSCGVGYRDNGVKCVAITTQRASVSKLSKKMSAYAMCLSMKNWTPDKQSSCMKAKGYK
jgi:hypothetical protein